MKDQIRPALTMLLLLTVLTGLVYPLAVTGLAQRVFPGPGERQFDRARRQGDRVQVDRTVF